MSFDCFYCTWKIFSAFEYVSPGHVSKLPFLIALSHVDLNGNPDTACMYHTSAYTLGRSYALCNEGIVFLFGVWFISNSSVGFRSKRHVLGSFFYLQPVRIGLPFGDNTVTSCLVKTTVNSALHIGPTPTSVLVKEGMIYPVVGKYDSKFGIGSIAVAENFSTCPFSMPTLIVEAFVSGGPCGDDWVMCKWVAPDSTIPVSCCGKICGASGVGI